MNRVLRYRPIQILFILLTAVSLGVSAVSACACSHHAEAKKAEVLLCHGPEHTMNEAAEVPIGTTTVDTDCACFADQPSPVIVSKSETKKSKASSETGVSAAEVIAPKFVSLSAKHSALPNTVKQFSRSTILESLLPARAPPRL